MARVEAFGGRHRMGLRQGGSVQWLSGSRAVTRSRPNPKSRSYESLFFFSSPAWNPLYSFLFQANEPAVKETCIPLYNLRQAWPGCSFSIKRNFSCLSFPIPWHPNWRCCALPCCSTVVGAHMGGGLGQHWLHRHEELICHRGAVGSRAVLSRSFAPLAPFYFLSGRGNKFPFT